MPVSAQHLEHRSILLGASSQALNYKYGDRKRWGGGVQGWGLIYLDRSPLRLELPTHRHFQLQLCWNPGNPLCFYGLLGPSV